MVTRGFTGRGRPPEGEGRIPPGQHLVDDFPRSFGRSDAADRTRKLDLHAEGRPATGQDWNWAEFNALPQTKLTRDIHCVTTWSKFDTPGKACSSTTSSPRPALDSADRVHARSLRRRLLDQRADRGSRRRQGDDRLALRQASRSSPITAAPRACWCRTSTSGSRRSG